MTDPASVSIAQIVACTQAEGPGRRFALWLQGCPFRCPGCCNPEMLPAAGGKLQQVSDLLNELDAAMTLGIEGITMIGGEPFMQAAAARRIAWGARQRGLSVMIFSGYRLEELKRSTDPEAHQLLAFTDVLVDGRYDRQAPDTSRRWIGSTNQEVHFLTDRYNAESPCWAEPDTLEIRMSDGEITINGFPAAKASSIWRRV